MDAGRLPLFCDTALAERIERAEAQLIAEASQAAHRRQADTAGFVIPISGGVASFAEEGSPFNKVAGLGFGGVPGAAALDEIERAFTVCGAVVQIEIAHLADPAIGMGASRISVSSATPLHAERRRGTTTTSPKRTRAGPGSCGL